MTHKQGERDRQRWQETACNWEGVKVKAGEHERT
jgi:hypothetical protein